MKHRIINLRSFTLLAAGLIALGTGCWRATSAPGEKWGTAYNPSDVCTITWTNGDLAMALPGGIFDLSPYQRTNQVAPRVLQKVTGDFVAEVKVTSDLDPGDRAVIPGRAAYFGAGLLLWENATNYVRLERNEWSFGNRPHQRHGPLFEHWANNTNRINNAVFSNSFFHKDATWLRLERIGDQVTASYSHDGDGWTIYRSAKMPLGADLQIGVAAISTSVKPFNVKFSDFKVQSLR